MDHYENYAQLSAAEREGVDYAVRVLRREAVRTVVLAPHGGGIEPGSSELARAIAGPELSLAVFEGIRPDDNGRLHITSTRFDEPRCLELVQEADHVVAIHGERSREPAVFLGGRDVELGDHVRAALERQGFAVRAHDNPRLQGTATANICNRGSRGRGIQLELASGLRRSFFASLTTAGRSSPTDELARFAAAVREGLRAGGAL